MREHALTSLPCASQLLTPKPTWWAWLAGNYSARSPLASWPGGPAREGLRLVRDIAGLIGLEPEKAQPTGSQIEAVCRRLSAAGYRLKSDPDLSAFAARRAEHACDRCPPRHAGGAVAAVAPGRVSRSLTCVNPKPGQTRLRWSFPRAHV